MITTEEIELKIKENLEVQHIQVIDLRGGDHIMAVIVSPVFENKMLIEQHKIIYDILSNEMKSNVIHALTLKTYTPIQWGKVKPTFKADVGHSI